MAVGALVNGQVVNAIAVVIAGCRRKAGAAQNNGSRSITTGHRAVIADAAGGFGLDPVIPRSAGADRAVGIFRYSHFRAFGRAQDVIFTVRPDFIRRGAGNRIPLHQDAARPGSLRSRHAGRRGQTAPAAVSLTQPVERALDAPHPVIIHLAGNSRRVVIGCRGSGSQDIMFSEIFRLAPLHFITVHGDREGRPGHQHLVAVLSLAGLHCHRRSQRSPAQDRRAVRSRADRALGPHLVVIAHALRCRGVRIAGHGGGVKRRVVARDFIGSRAAHRRPCDIHLAVQRAFRGRDVGRGREPPPTIGIRPGSADRKTIGGFHPVGIERTGHRSRVVVRQRGASANDGSGASRGIPPDFISRRHAGRGAPRHRHLVRVGILSGVNGSRRQKLLEAGIADAVSSLVPVNVDPAHPVIIQLARQGRLVVMQRLGSAKRGYAGRIADAVGFAPPDFASRHPRQGRPLDAHLVGVIAICRADPVRRRRIHNFHQHCNVLRRLQGRLTVFLIGARHHNYARMNAGIEGTDIVSDRNRHRRAAAVAIAWRQGSDPGHGLRCFKHQSIIGVGIPDVEAVVGRITAMHDLLAQQQRSHAQFRRRVFHIQNNLDHGRRIIGIIG